MSSVTNFAWSFKGQESEEYQEIVEQPPYHHPTEPLRPAAMDKNIESNKINIFSKS